MEVNGTRQCSVGTKYFRNIFTWQTKLFTSWLGFSFLVAVAAFLSASWGLWDELPFQSNYTWRTLGWWLMGNLTLGFTGCIPLALLCKAIIAKSKILRSSQILHPPRFLDSLVGLGVALYFTTLLLAFWPGIWSIDSINHWKEADAMSFSNWHPFLYPWSIGILQRLHLGPTSIVFAHILLTAYVYSAWYYITVSLGLNRKISVFLLICSLLPPSTSLFFLHVWKDIPFSCAIMLQSLCLLKIANHRLLGGEQRRRDILLLTVCSFFAASLRHNGVASLLLSAIGLLLARVPSRLLLGSFLLPLLFLYGSLIALGNSLKVHQTHIREMPILYALTPYLSANAEQPLATQLPAQQLPTNEVTAIQYNCFVGDLTIASARLDLRTILGGPESLGKYLLGSIAKDPLPFIRHVLCASSILWRVSEPAGGQTGVHALFPMGVGDVRYVEPNDYGIRADSYFPFLRNIFFAYFMKSLSPLYKALLWRPGIYLTALLVTSWAIYFHSPKTRLGLIALLPLLSIVPTTMAIGTPDYRYFFPLIWGVPLLVPLLIITATTEETHTRTCP